MKKYQVRGILKKDGVAKPFCVEVEAKSIKKANERVKETVASICNEFYTNRKPIQCIINKKTVRCDNV